jgi:hypothetical protein
MKIGALGAIAIIVIAVLAFMYLSGEEGPGPALEAYAGRLKVNLLQVKRIDGTAYALAGTITKRMIHGRLDYNDKVADFSGYSVTGEMKPTDSGVWYLIIDYATNNTLWLDADETLKDPYVRSIFGFDGDKDGFLEECVELGFFGLGQLQAGESYKERDVKLVFDPARTSSITFSSLTNASSIGTTSYAYYTATGYMTGFTEGDMAKIAKIQIMFNETGDSTYPDTNKWMLTHLKLGPYTITGGQFGAYDLANTRYQIMFGDQVNGQNGRDMFYAKNAGDLWASYELKAYCKYAAGSQNVTPVMVFYFYKPDGTLTTGFGRITAFDS